MAAAGPVISAFKPQLVVLALKDDEAVQFCKAAFSAEELKRATNSKRKADQETPLIVSVELKIGASVLIVFDHTDDAAAAAVMEGAISGGIVLRLETDDVQGAVDKALKAGAKAEGDIVEEEGPCGGVVGKVKDPFGVVWTIASVAKGFIGGADA